MTLAFSSKKKRGGKQTKNKNKKGRTKESYNKA